MPPLFDLDYSWFSIGITTLIIYTIGILCTQIVNRSQFLSVPSNLPAAIFYIISNFLPDPLSIDFWNAAALLLVLFFNKLFKAYQKSRPERNYFDVAFLLGVLSIIYLEYTLYLPAIFVSCFYLSNVKLRYWFVDLIAFTMPWAYWLTFLYWTDTLAILEQQYLQLMPFGIDAYIAERGTFSLGFIILVVLGVISSGVWIFRRANLEDFQSPILRISTLFVLVTIIVLGLYPMSQFHLILLLTNVLVYLISFWFYKINRKLANVLLILLFGIALVYPFLDHLKFTI